MPAFSAINVESEDNFVEEVDTTRELHIEEALKRFQTALKLHAQGPKHFDEAAEAYQELFDSEIFHYPDAITEFDRAEEQSDPRPDAPGSAHIHELEAAQLDIAQHNVDSSGSSLPQALYLAYKNHGQFLLDNIKHQARVEGKSVFEQKETCEKAREALEHLSVALDHDPSDADLWRRTARVAAFLQSTRASRYCLEAAIELDDDPVVDEVEPPSLAEGLAGQQLKGQLEVLGDDTAMSHPILAPYLKRTLATFLNKFLDPIPFLPDPSKSLATSPSPDVTLPRLTLQVQDSTWAALGMSLVHAMTGAGVSARPMSIELSGETSSPSPPQKVLVKRDKSTEPGRDTQGDAIEKTSKDATQVQDTVVLSTAKTRRSESVISRKRSHSAAAVPDEPEEIVEKRSKRTRRRETAVEDSGDAQPLYATQLEPLQAVDKTLFQTTKNLAENLGVSDPITLQRLTEIIDLSASERRTAKVTEPSMVDLRDSLVNFEEDMARILLNKHEASSIGFSSFLEHAKPGSQLKTEVPAFEESRNIKSFVSKMNDDGVGMPDISFEWVRSVFRTYTDSKWSDTLKTAVVQVISHLDEEIYNRTLFELQSCNTTEQSAKDLASLDHMVQTLFELHLDVYERITNPNSAVDFGIRVETKGRLGRWFSLASHLSRNRPEGSGGALSARYLWAVVFSVTLTESVSREHILQCWQSLREALAVDFQDIAVALPNNAIMPEISTQAADREISKLTTMDFFLGLFSDDLSHPISVIDSLEPVLNPAGVFTASMDQLKSPSPSEQLRSSSEQPDVVSPQPIAETASQGLHDLWKFLLSASTELRLFLWNRLGAAYRAIAYPTKVFSCNLKAIEMVVGDFEKDPYLSMPVAERRPLFLKMLKFLDNLLVQTLSVALNDPTAFDIIDDDHIKSSVAALAKLACILHTASMFEDEFRVGMSSAPSTSTTFSSFFNKLRELQVRNWSLLYTLLKTGVFQNKSTFQTPEADLADYLAAVHRVLGLRKCCKASNKIFLKMMRVELLKQNLIDNWEDYMGQVLYDLYGLKGIGMGVVHDHGCTPEKLERRNTMALVEKVSALANSIPMKDLLKSDLKTTIETMQQAVGQTKSNQQTIHNLRNFNEYLRRPIHPLRLYQALRGNVTIDAVAVTTPDSVLAKHQWFFLLGMIAFSKFKGVDLNRRQTPGATDDLRMGATFLRQQLQFTPDQWNAWLRLAECFDYELDELVLWSADKMNKERAELVRHQRSAIHCYALALSNSRKAGPDFEGEALEAIHELYHKFGMRMYASSRGPFDMEPFQHADQERFFIQNMGAGTFKRKIHEEMEDYKVWKYAATLFKKASAVKPEEWKNFYMYAKCIWKMFQKPYTSLDHKDRQSRPMVEDVLAALERSVEVVSALKKPRSGDPILEPHYKIVSVVNKLVSRGDLSTSEAAALLQRQPFAAKRSSPVTVTTPDEWNTYLIESLQHLREKDKSNWQHRIIMRYARTLFDENAENPEHSDALAAFTVLQKSVFTKTMVMSVWKCDAERPGRHHVYTEQYVRFMVKILCVLKDRGNFDQLLRRIRKKSAEFYHFNDLWQSCCISYLKLIRSHFNIEPVLEDVYKNVSPDEFEIITERVNEWSIDAPVAENPALGALKETIELKKLNSGLMKAGAIDDLITDCYTAIYMDVGKSLPGPPPEALIQERAEAKARDEKAAGDPEKPNNSFSMLLNPQSVDNSGTEAGPAAAAPEGGARQRRIGVRRPDILRKAEQAASRNNEGPVKASSAKSVRGSVSSGRTRGSKTPVGEEDKDGNIDMEDGGEESSAPGSIHDSADDESDLSDVPASEELDEEEKAIRLYMFPGLARRSMDNDAGEEGHDESGDEGGDEEEEQEDEEEDAEDVDIADDAEEIEEDDEGMGGEADDGLAHEVDEPEEDDIERPADHDEDDEMADAEDLIDEEQVGEDTENEEEPDEEEEEDLDEDDEADEDLDEDEGEEVIEDGTEGVSYHVSL